ncbi:MAG: hypothetical protein JWO76_3433, partial [Nocardioides sp.]|nr:hypothetical protein [Nocardioides sp.]
MTLTGDVVSTGSTTEEDAALALLRHRPLVVL